MKGISLTQPWASLMACGAKQNETRSWQTHCRGLVAIHAAKHWSYMDREMCLTEPFLSAMVDDGRLIHTGPTTISVDMPLGVIVAVGELVACHMISRIYANNLRDTNPQEYAFGNYDTGRFVWSFRDVRRLVAPIPCRGSLGLWNVPTDIEEALHANAATG